MKPVDQNIRHKPLRICLLSYRGNPYCGGQGVYIRHLSHALCDLGHHVDVVSGPPYPHLDNGARLHRLKSLDLYNPNALFRTPGFQELLNPINLIEWLGVTTMGFPEPLTFGMRVNRFISSLKSNYDVVHDNQSLSYGIWALSKRLPLVATIHHPITVDRDMALRSCRSFTGKLQQWRWYSFIGMQKRVACALKRIITLSQIGRRDISQAFKIPKNHISVIPNGIDTHGFFPLPDIKREPFRLIVTTSADSPLKGLTHLLVALAGLASAYPQLHLVIVGEPPAESSPTLKRIREMGLLSRVSYTGRINQKEYVKHYARAWAAVVPSVYEGFGLPAGEAMACGVPVISTTGGALPELIGQSGLLVPPADAKALASAIARLCDDPELASNLGYAGRQRVLTHFTWEAAARSTLETYYRAIDDYRRFNLPDTTPPLSHS